VYVFTEPTSGWSGVVREAARITLPGAVTAATLSGTTLIALGEDEVIGAHENVARAPVFVLRRPAAGWRKLKSPQPRAFVQTGPGQDTDFGPEPATLVGGTTAFTNVKTCSDQGIPRVHRRSGRSTV
jgi:hypothetical protein